MKNSWLVVQLANRREIGLYLVAAAIILAALRFYQADYLADDGAFFLRYAENFANGYFWVWNLNEPPIWGASAPFWPVIIAPLIAGGMAPKASLILVGYLTALTGFLLITWLLARHFGKFTAITFVVFLAINAIVVYFALSGLESPLTYLLLALVLWVVLSRPALPWWVTGGVAGLLLIHKIDVAPLALFLLLAEGVKLRRWPIKPLLLMLVLGCAWYGFATLYFGAPLPNSFYTKLLRSQHGNLAWWWFLHNIAIRGGQKVLLLFIPFSFYALWRTNKPLLIFAWGLIVTHTIAYTLKVPSEPFEWYFVPTRLVLLVLAAIGFTHDVPWVAHFGWLPAWYKNVLKAAALLVVAVFGHFADMPDAAGTVDFANIVEADRTNAGQWAAENAPVDGVVLTGFGNTSYWSARNVIDSSFLNRRLEQGNLVEKYAPEVIILFLKPPNILPEQYQAADGYKVAKTFDKSLQFGRDVVCVVLFREDIPLPNK